MTIVKWTSILILTIIAGILLSQWLIDESVRQVPVCARLADPAFGRCLQNAELAVAQGESRITAIGIAVAIISTVALIVTIALTAQATAAATRAVELANEEIKQSKYVSSLELRPYLILEDVAIRYYCDIGGPVTGWSVAIKMQNAGSTPARYAVSRTQWQIFDVKPPGNFAFPWSGDVEDYSLVGPGGNITGNTEIIPAEVIDRVIRGEQRLHVWHWIEYQGFTPNERYRTETHVQMTLFAGTSQSRDLKFNANLHPRHNGMDEDCTCPLVTPYVTKAMRRSTPVSEHTA
ncbi:hypothetical protein SAMIE_1028220 [Sphingobium amiense]|uniref:Uncharacterized protein n=1 Tax=Sphingobium amiense TaxID=135719 RepID=A0A494W520_9SPHN|nr:hypothetical protein [Sphingobium amiense]BBD99321.1 hypothetical protein SAMIE_1028220 [Sphingobium amiense]